MGDIQTSMKPYKCHQLSFYFRYIFDLQIGNTLRLSFIHSPSGHTNTHQRIQQIHH